MLCFTLALLCFFICCFTCIFLYLFALSFTPASSWNLRCSNVGTWLIVSHIACSVAFQAFYVCFSLVNCLKHTLNLHPASLKEQGNAAAAAAAAWSRRCAARSARGTPPAPQRCGHATGARAHDAPCADTVSCGQNEVAF